MFIYILPVNKGGEDNENKMFSVTDSLFDCSNVRCFKRECICSFKQRCN